jgi:predicted RNA-binding protein with PUA-like domain
MSYWLMKSEPEVFGIDDLAKAKRKTTHWDGVRNFQARNFMRDRMRRGDRAFFYHSNCEEPGIVGIVKIVREGYPDSTAFDSGDAHFDPGSNRDNPRWYMVDVQLERKFRGSVALATLREHDKGALKGLALLKRGNRLSVMPVSAAHWKFIVDLAR